MAALGTSGTGEAVGEDAALEILAKLPLDVGRYRTAIPVVFPCEGEIGLQLLLNDAVENRVLRTATRVRNGSTSLRRDGHVGVRTEARVRIDTVYMYSIAASLQHDPLFDSCGTKSYVKQSDTIFWFSPHNVFQTQWIFYAYHIEIFLLQRIRRCYFGNDLCAILPLGKTHLVEDEL